MIRLVTEECGSIRVLALVAVSPSIGRKHSRIGARPDLGYRRPALGNRLTMKEGPGLETGRSSTANGYVTKRGREALASD